MPTDFESRVYRTISRIPRGRVSTYKIVAARLHCGSCQAVGQALRRNPFAPKVPCHRVIASDLTLGGFAGHRSGKRMAAGERESPRQSQAVGGDIRGVARARR